MSNLRIKNKKLKRELELLKGRTVQPNLVYNNCEIATLMSRKTYDDSVYERFPEDIIADAAILDLADSIKHYARFNSYRDHVTGKIVFEASLDVAKKGGLIF